MTDNHDQKKDIVRPYKVDGIEEYDNPMPRWWVGLFYACIAFSVVYLGYYHFAGGPTLEDEYTAEVSATATQLAASKPASDLPLSERLKSSEAIAQGKAIYDTNCFPCHGQLGEGGIGPNLTDTHWIHGGKPENVVKSVGAGIPDKGMVSWQPILGDLKVEQVAAYVLSLKGTNPPNGKAPQGEFVEP